MVSRSNNSQPTGVVKFVYERLTFPLTETAVYSKGHTFKNLLIILLIETEEQQTTKAERSLKCGTQTYTCIVYQKYIGTSIKVGCATRSLYGSSGPKTEGVPINNQKGRGS